MRLYKLPQPIIQPLRLTIQTFKNNIETRREFKIFYRKGTGVLLKITLDNIEKKKLKLKELVKGNR